MPEAIHAPKQVDPAVEAAVTPQRVVLLTNFIPPYQKPVLEQLAKRFQTFRVLLSTAMETNRPWYADTGNLDVAVQKNWTFYGRWRHSKGFRERLYVHVPVDTLAQLHRFRPDVVISGELGARSLLAAIYRRLRPRIKLIFFAEFSEFTEQGRGWTRAALRRLLIRQADCLLVVGESGAQYLRSIGAEEHRMFRAIYATDVAVFGRIPPFRPAEASRRLLYVGQLTERKGLMPFAETLLRWAAMHPEWRVSWLIAGDGPLREALAGLKRPPNVELEMIGNVPYHELPEVYRQAGIFVLPSLADTWGLVVNEALATGLPVLGSLYAQAVSEMVVNGENGWTFRPDRDDECWRAIDRSLTVPAARLSAMRESARETALRFTPEHAADLFGRAVTALTKNSVPFSR